MAIHSGNEWRHNNPGGRCLFAVDRWRAEILTPAGMTIMVKGVSEEDANRLAIDYNGGVSRSRIWVFADGTEQLDPWEEVDPWVRLSR